MRKSIENKTHGPRHRPKMLNGGRVRAYPIHHSDESMRNRANNYSIITLNGINWLNIIISRVVFIVFLCITRIDVIYTILFTTVAKNNSANVVSVSFRGIKNVAKTLCDSPYAV